MKRGLPLLLLAILLSVRCGYHLTGRGRNLPAAARTAAMPGLVNETATFGADRFINAALAEEFLRRGRLRQCPAAEKADLRLEGRITAFETARVAAKRWEVRVSVQIRLIDLVQNVPLFDGSGLSYREAYEAPGEGQADGKDFFSLPAETRDAVAARLAAAMVSSVLDGF
jgi:hypothetical protein